MEAKPLTPPPPPKKNFFDGIFEFVKASLQKQAKLLGVTMNKRLTLKHHMNNIMHWKYTVFIKTSNIVMSFNVPIFWRFSVSKCPFLFPFSMKHSLLLTVKIVPGWIQNSVYGYRMVDIEYFNTTLEEYKVICPV